MSNLHDQLLNLSPAEKFDSLDAVWESREADKLSLTAARREELDSRLTEYQLNPDHFIPWEQVGSDLVVWTPEVNADLKEAFASFIIEAGFNTRWAFLQGNHIFRGTTTQAFGGERPFLAFNA